MLAPRAAGDTCDRRARVVGDSEYGQMSFWRWRRLAQQYSVRLELLGLEGLEEMATGRSSKTEEQGGRVRDSDSDGLGSTVAVVVMAPGCCHCSDRIARLAGNPRAARSGVLHSVVEAGVDSLLQTKTI